FVWELLNLHG
ncbi:unnamed protein product, partial [Allacma fusca]